MLTFIKYIWDSHSPLASDVTTIGFGPAFILSLKFENQAQTGGGQRRLRICWVWDQASPHRSDAVRRALRSIPETVAVLRVPAGLTWLLQVLDVYLFRRLKSELPLLAWQLVVKLGKPKMTKEDCVHCTSRAFAKARQGMERKV